MDGIVVDQCDPFVNPCAVKGAATGENVEAWRWRGRPNDDDPSFYQGKGIPFFS